MYEGHSRITGKSKNIKTGDLFFIKFDISVQQLFEYISTRFDKNPLPILSVITIFVTQGMAKRGKA